MTRCLILLLVLLLPAADAQAKRPARFVGKEVL